jgi:Helix-turn-helix family
MGKARDQNPSLWSTTRTVWAERCRPPTVSTSTSAPRDGRDEIEWRTDRLADGPWQALGPGRSARLSELTAPLLGAAFESGLLPAQSTLGIATVPVPSPRPYDR